MGSSQKKTEGRHLLPTMEAHQQLIVIHCSWEEQLRTGWWLWCQTLTTFSVRVCAIFYSNILLLSFAAFIVECKDIRWGEINQEHYDVAESPSPEPQLYHLSNYNPLQQPSKNGSLDRSICALKLAPRGGQASQSCVSLTLSFRLCFLVALDSTLSAVAPE